MTGASNHNSTPRCPRCGYDQSGLIATWTASCPLEATCTECGYAFDPADAIASSRTRLRWFYEHARPWNLFAVCTTFAVLIWPPSFWKRVRPEFPVRTGRIIAWVIVLSATSILGVGVVYWAGHETYHFFQQRLNQTASPRVNFPPPKPLLRAETFPRFLNVLTAGAWQQGQPGGHLNFPMSAFGTAAFATTAAIVAFCLYSRRRDDLAPSHFLRVWAYSLAPVFLIHLSFGLALASSWVRLSVLTALELSSSPKPTTVRLSNPNWVIELARGGLFTQTLVAGLLWQLLYFACAFRKGLRLRPWIAPWALASLVGIIAAAVALWPTLIVEWSS